MNRLKNSLIGVVVVCMWFVLSCSLYAEDLPQQVPEADQSGQRFITIDFDNVDIRLFIKYISELSGKNFVVDKAVQGNVTILSPTKISEDEAYKVFESVLEVHGFTTIVAGSVIKILPSARARSENVQLLKMGATDAPEDRVVTQLIRLKYSSPDDIKKVLAPLVSQTSVIISHAPSGMLIITETMSNIQKLLGIIEVLDVESREDEIAFIPVVNASADAIAKIITTVYQKNSGPQKAGTTRGSGDSIKVVPYDRVNALIVLASGSDLIRVKRLIAALDTEVQRAEGNFHVYYLQNATAVDLAAVLNDLPSAQAEDSTNKGKIAAISKDVRVMPDAETNSLIIRATKDEYLILENVIKQLDIPRRMVYLEALIMEVDVDKNFEVGVEWATTGTFSNGKFISGSSGSDGFFNLIDSDSSGGTPTLNNPGSGFTLGILKQGVNIGGLNFTNIGAVLKAFQSDSDVNVIATPQILTMDNKKADISVGEQVPYQTSKNTTDALQNYTQYEYKDVATKLSITPHINQSDVLRLEIETEVVRIKNLGLDGLTPTTFNRTATTTVILNDRSTIVIGGMIGHDGNESTYKVPFLGDIPLIGWLF